MIRRRKKERMKAMRFLHKEHEERFNKIMEMLEPNIETEHAVKVSVYVLSSIQKELFWFRRYMENDHFDVDSMYEESETKGFRLNRKEKEEKKEYVSADEKSIIYLAANLMYGSASYPLDLEQILDMNEDGVTLVREVLAYSVQEDIIEKDLV